MGILSHFQDLDERYDDPQAWEEFIEAVLLPSESVEAAYKLRPPRELDRSQRIAGVLAFTDKRLLHLGNGPFHSNRERHGLDHIASYPYASITDSGIGYDHHYEYAYLEMGLARGRRLNNTLHFRLDEGIDAREVYRRLNQHILG